ncbi:MAG: oxidoreductase [Verrucomicrobiota bacterium]
MKPNQKVILITGASSGIGYDAAKTLVGEGHIVYVAARRVQNMEPLRELGCTPLKLDITREEDIQEVVNTILQAQQTIDVLINNAGFGLYGPVEEITIEEARYQFEVNLFGLARLTQLLIPTMRQQGSGTIINMSSIGGKIYAPMGAWYHATKHALEGWSDSLRTELASFGINVVLIEPGAIQSEFGDVMAKPMVEKHGSGPYRDLVSGLNEAQRKEYEGGGGSHPRVISRVIAEAIHASKPKTRYAAGKYAAPLLFIRRWFSDRFFDRIIMSMVKAT